MMVKSIEITYDFDAIPGMCAVSATPGTVRRDEADRALEFRDAAIELIEDALIGAGAGEWEAAGIGQGEVNCGFAVDDFDEAETIVRTAVSGTPFAGIREIVRRAVDSAEMHP